MRFSFAVPSPTVFTGRRFQRVCFAAFSSELMASEGSCAYQNFTEQVNSFSPRITATKLKSDCGRFPGFCKGVYVAADFAESSSCCFPVSVRIKGMPRRCAGGIIPAIHIDNFFLTFPSVPKQSLRRKRGGKGASPVTPGFKFQRFLLLALDFAGCRGEGTGTANDIFVHDHKTTVQAWPSKATASFPRSISLVARPTSTFQCT